jgi:FlaG/FlaF family flagellin (archaellin)
MSRILLLPIATILAASGVVLGPGEDVPAPPPQTSITPAGETGIRLTNR